MTKQIVTLQSQFLYVFHHVKDNWAKSERDRQKIVSFLGDVTT